MKTSKSLESVKGQIKNDVRALAELYERDTIVGMPAWAPTQFFPNPHFRSELQSLLERGARELAESAAADLHGRKHGPIILAAAEKLTTTKEIFSFLQGLWLDYSGQSPVEQVALGSDAPLLAIRQALKNGLDQFSPVVPVQTEAELGSDPAATPKGSGNPKSRGDDQKVPAYWSNPTPLYYFDSWPTRELPAAAQNQLKRTLLQIQAAFLDGAVGEYPEVGCWRRSFDAIASAFHAVGLLTENGIALEIPAMVADAGASGRWVFGRNSMQEPSGSFTELLGHEYYQPGFPNNYFRAHLQGRQAFWRGRLLEQTGGAPISASATDGEDVNYRNCVEVLDASDQPIEVAGTTSSGPIVDLLARVVEQRRTTIEKWADEHKFGRTTVFDWRALRRTGQPLKGRVSSQKSAEIEQAIREDAKSLGLITRTDSD